jgi:hypothetical protein
MASLAPGPLTATSTSAGLSAAALASCADVSAQAGATACAERGMVVAAKSTASTSPNRNRRLAEICTYRTCATSTEQASERGPPAPDSAWTCEG